MINYLKDNLNLANAPNIAWTTLKKTSGIYIRESDTMVISTQSTSDIFCRCFLHELVHSTGHPSRLNRPLSFYKESPFEAPSIDYTREEIIAEVGAIVLMDKLSLFNKKIQDVSIEYLKGWLEYNLVIKGVALNWNEIKESALYFQKRKGHVHFNSVKDMLHNNEILKGVLNENNSLDTKKN